MKGLVRHCRVHWPLWIGLVVAGFGLFLRLGTGALWEDEAETAVLARNTARWGYPRVQDGRNVVTQEYGRDANTDGVWVLSPWLPIYLVAASFKLFGVSALTARLPFAVIAWLTVAAVYGAGRRLSMGDAATAWATLLLATSVPFLLFGRQCRGYPLSALLLLVLVYLWAGLGSRGRTVPWRTMLALGLVSGLLFHSNYLVLLLALPGIVIVALGILRPIMAGVGLLGACPSNAVGGASTCSGPVRDVRGLGDAPRVGIP